MKIRIVVDGKERIHETRGVATHVVVPVWEGGRSFGRIYFRVTEFDPAARVWNTVEERRESGAALERQQRKLRADALRKERADRQWKRTLRSAAGL